MKSNISINKQKDISRILDLLNSTYKSPSQVYQIVEKALNKLTSREVDCLFVMILTSKENSPERNFNGGEPDEVTERIEKVLKELGDLQDKHFIKHFTLRI